MVETILEVKPVFFVATDLMPKLVGEIFLILEGQVQVEIEGQAKLKVSGGQVAYLPPMTKHNVRNRGTVPLKYIFIVARAIN